MSLTHQPSKLNETTTLGDGTTATTIGSFLNDMRYKNNKDKKR